MKLITEEQLEERKEQERRGEERLLENSRQAQAVSVLVKTTRCSELEVKTNMEIKWDHLVVDIMFCS